MEGIQTGSTALAEAMRLHRAGLAEIWGPEFPHLIQMLEVTTGDWKDKRPSLERRITAADEVFVYCGERCLPPDSEQLNSVTHVIRETVYIKNRLPHLLFSGGVEDEVRIKESRLSALQINEISARRMYGRLLKDYGSDDEILGLHASFDHLSDNTGDQAFIAKGWIEGRVRAKKQAVLVVYLPMEHIARWLLTFGWAWRELKSEYRARLRVVTFANGQWTDETRCGLTRADEAFIPRKLPEHQEVLQKFGYQYGDRLYVEARYGEERGYRCAALMPSQMAGVFASLD